ncbi:hypothetical protein ABVN80_11610 [Acinetobacter baumannii]
MIGTLYAVSITQDDYLIEAPQEIFTQFKELQQQQKNYWVNVLARSK